MRRMGTRGNMCATGSMGCMGNMGGMIDMGGRPGRAQCGQPPEHGRNGNMRAWVTRVDVGIWAARTAMLA